MSREIKFRAWDQQRKKYHYPELWDNTMPSNWKDFFVLEQFTGLKDKNGKDIYEGDICLYGSETKRTIVFKEGCFQSVGKSVSSNFGFNHLEKGHEIIGNIQENPELL